MSKKYVILEFVREYLQLHRGRSPSYDEIMAACGLQSKSHVLYHIDKLVEEGLLEQRNGARGLSIPGSKLVLEE